MAVRGHSAQIGDRNGVRFGITGFTALAIDVSDRLVTDAAKPNERCAG
ncbi:hypothetical protein [Streptomyces sp. NPDC005799]